MNAKKAKKLRKAIKAVEKEKDIIVSSHRYRAIKRMYTRGMLSFLVLFALCLTAHADKLEFGCDRTPRELKAMLEAHGFKVALSLEDIDADTFAQLGIEGGLYVLNTLRPVTEKEMIEIMGVING